MPEMDYSQENKSQSVFDMDMLRLKDKGEKARIAIMDSKTRMLVCHYVATIGADGKRTGRFYACLGKYETVMKDGIDPAKCPACKVAEPGRDVAVSIPRRRFAVHIARYRTNSKGQVMQPVSLGLEVWVFGDDKFNKLVDRAEEHGDLRKKDIVLTCTAPNYQQFDIDVSPKLLLGEHPQAIEQYTAMKEKRTNDVERLIGQVLTYEQLEALTTEATPAITDDEIAEAGETTLAEVIEELEIDTAPIVEEEEEVPVTTLEEEVPAGVTVEPVAASTNGTTEAAAPDDLPAEAATAKNFAALLEED